MTGKHSRISMGIDAYPEIESAAIIAILCNVPDSVCANSLAQVLLEARLAACVNILPPVTSLYRWQEKIEKAVEIPLLIKTTAGCFLAVRQKICAWHPYDVPEILVFAVDGGLTEYLQWVVANVQPGDEEAACATD